MRYRYYTNMKDTVIVETSYEGRPVKAKAKCSPHDTFNYDYGCALAKARVDVKVAHLRMNRAIKKYNESLGKVADAREYYNAMSNYYLDSRSGYVTALTELRKVSEDMLKELNKQFVDRIKSHYAMVNGSNSASKFTIEAPQDESVSIGCSAQLWSVSGW